jgi:ribonuclease J
VPGQFVMATPKLRIIPIGGLGEIGKNMTVIELGNDAIIIDTGIMFPANDMHGVDYIIPDFGYLLERKDLKIHGIAYTHGHEDHTGAVRHVISALPGVPIYATPLTAGLIEVKLRNAELLDQTTINVFNPGDSFQLGPFKMESYHVCHSIPGGVGYGINTPYGLLVHSGDYKFDNTPVNGKPPDYAKLADFSRRGVTLLMADSTNADKPGWTPSESVVDEALEKVFREAEGRIFVATFASLISRIQQVINVAQRYDRKIVIAGRSMVQNVKMARDLKILKAPDNLFVDLNNVKNIAPSKLVIMATGAQGEPSAVLARMARGRHRQLEIQQGDTIVLSSHPIPGNEEMVYRIINRLFQCGANVIYDPIASVHVSGHARQDEMRLLLNLIRPKYFLPVHGELRHLREHAKLGVEAGVPKENIITVENGHVIEITKGGISVGERIPGGYVFVDGLSVGDIGPVVIRDREILARDGFLLASIKINRKTGQLVGKPEIISRGFVYLREADELLQTVRETIENTVARCTPYNNHRCHEKMREDIKHMLYNETKRRPMVFSVITEV